jgi:hypothetical protein
MGVFGHSVELMNSWGGVLKQPLADVAYLNRLCGFGSGLRPGVGKLLPKSADQYRSVCTVSYRLISKLMTYRLSSFRIYMRVLGR